MRRGAIILWIIVTLAGLGLTEIWPKKLQSPASKQVGVLKSVKKEGFTSKVYIGDGMVTSYHFPKDLKPGDLVEVQGNFVDVLSLKNPGYARYLKSQGIHWTGRSRHWEDTGRLQPFYAWRNAAKIRLEEAVDFLYRGDGFLVKALLYADKEELDPRIQEDFSRTGTAHVLALSGFHTGILALLFHKLLFFIPTKQRTLFIGAFLLVYCFFTGMRPSILRATAFFLILYGSFLLARRYDVISAAAITASIFTAYNPYMVYDIGFQLSFLSVVSIGMFLPMLEDWAAGKKPFVQREDSILAVANGLHGEEEVQLCGGEEIECYGDADCVVGIYTGRHQEALLKGDRQRGQQETKERLVSAVFITLAAQILTVPVVAYYFHQVSMVSILANLIVLPGITLLMTGFLFSLLMLPLFRPGAQVLAGACRLLMRELLNFVDFLGAWRWAAIDIGEVPLWMVVVLLLAAICTWSWWEFKKTQKNKIFALQRSFRKGEGHG